MSDTPLFIHNTLSREKEEFKPLKTGEVSFYQCGPTVYWTQHIGNLRAMVMSDLIRRTFEYEGYKVNFVRNYTDVGHLTGDNLGDADTGEDRMEKAAVREGLSPEQIADKYIATFESDLRDLNIEDPTAKPRATDYIKQIQNMVQVLIDKGYAYPTDLAIYFDVSKAKDYTRLSGQNLEKNISGAGLGEVSDPQKKNPADFAVWFFRAGTHAAALQHWPSPFHSSLVLGGEGFPGWHIECSAMIKDILGDTIDVHMGGVEHIPVHHTNEIAQSEAANGAKLADYWMHNEHLLVDGGKMSKSEGTAFSLAEVKEKGFSPMALRYFFLQANYRSKQNFTWEALKDAEGGYNHLREIYTSLGDKEGVLSSEWNKKFSEKISDDFNIPQALAVTFDMLKSDLSNEDKLTTLKSFNNIFGLKLPKLYVLNTEPGKFLVTGSSVELTPRPIFFYGEKPSEEIIKIINERDLARQNSDWRKSDELRDRLLKDNIESKDTSTGSNYRKID